MTKFSKNYIIPRGPSFCGFNEQLDTTISTESSSKESVENILLFANKKYLSTVQTKRDNTKQLKNKPYVYTEGSSCSLLSKLYNITGNDWTSDRTQFCNGKNSSTCFCYHSKKNITHISDQSNLSDERHCLKNTSSEVCHFNHEISKENCRKRQPTLKYIKPVCQRVLIPSTPYAQSNDCHCLDDTPSSLSVCDINREILIENYRKKQPTLKYPKPVCPRVIQPSTPFTRECLNKPATCPSDPARIHILSKRVFDRNLKKLTDRTSNVEGEISSIEKKRRKLNKRKVACGIEQAKKFFLLMVSRHNKKLFKEILNSLIKQPKVKPKVCPIFRKNPKLKKIKLCPYNCTKFH